MLAAIPAVILAGGLGTRIGADQSNVPKPLTRIANVPILMRIILGYARFDVKKFFVLGGYKVESFCEYFRSIAISNKGNFFLVKTPFGNIEIEVVDTGLDTATGGRVHLVANRLADCESFFLTYGDGLANIRFDEQWQFHRFQGRIATCTAVVPPSRFAKLEIVENAVVGFKEKFDSEGFRISGGFFIFNSPDIFRYIRTEQDVLEEEPLRQLADKKQLTAFFHDGFWQCLDTPRDLKTLNQMSTREPFPWTVL